MTMEFATMRGTAMPVSTAVLINTAENIAVAAEAVAERNE